jgi:predicted naringenin-chalcone synthase
VVSGAVLTGSGHAFPAAVPHDGLWTDFFAAHFGHDRVARRIWASAGVRQRHTVADPRAEDLSGWSTAARMDRYGTEAVPLGKDALTGALAAAGLDPADVGLFTVVSCTGYATPGVDIRLARDLGLADSVQRLFVGHMGCYAALPALGAAADFVTARGRPAVVLCLELTSLHVQPAAAVVDLEQVVAHALFSDAAAAVVLEPAGSGLAVVDVTARTDVATADHMTWEVTDLGFRMGLSPRVPDVLAVHVGPVVADLLARNGVRRDEVAGWAVHPGGPRILDVVVDRLGLPADALDASREVLAEHGNCSSATVLLVLAELVRRTPPAAGQYVVALAFGPGLTLYATLLRAT